jgi:hypothetical protein
VASSRSEFLLQCLDLFQVDLCRGSEDKRMFFENAIEQLTTKESIAVSELPDLDPQREKSGGRTPKTYDAWLRQFADRLAESQQRLSDLREACGVLRHPVIARRAGGGSGNETTYFIDVAVDEPAEQPPATPATPATPAPPSEPPPAQDQSATVKYRTTAIAEPPAWISALSPFLARQRHRRVLLVWSAILVSLLIVGGIDGILPKVQFVSDIGAWAYVLTLFAVITLVINPVLVIFRLVIYKVAIIGALDETRSRICVLDLVPGKECDEAPLRKLNVLQVSADCPICLAKHGLSDTVTLRHKGMLEPKLIGCCYNNPTEHRFSFDKDSLLGRQI